MLIGEREKEIKIREVNGAVPFWAIICTPLVSINIRVQSGPTLVVDGKALSFLNKNLNIYFKIFFLVTDIFRTSLKCV